MPTPTTTSPSSPLPTFTEVDSIGQSGIWVQCIFCMIFILVSISFAIHTRYVDQKRRTFHSITSLLTAVTALTHYIMITGYGSVLVIFAVEPDRVIMREIFYSRFLAWYVTAPLIAWYSMLLADLEWFDTFMLLVMVELGVTSGLMAALVADSIAMWVWYGFQALFCTYVLCILFVNAASMQPGHVSSLYNSIRTLVFLFVLIILAFLQIGDGAGKVSVNTEAIALSFCDFGLCILIPVILIVICHRKTKQLEYGSCTFPEHLYKHHTHDWEGAIRLN